jgi:DNA (cytosine-5)-methyltransferase 1
VDNTEYINTVEWFFGYGGNHLGIKRVLPNLRLVAACEIESYPLANMVAKMEKGLLDSAPIWTDCKTFPTEPFKGGKVDLFIASYPCQPFSAAGKRQGSEDERHLWPYCREFIRETKPGICFFENVEGHISLGLREVLADLVKLGYRVESDGGEATWGLFSAAECGAPHQRKRVFILATLDDSTCRESIINSMLLRQAKRKDNIFGCASTTCTELGNPKSNNQRRPPIPTMHREGVAVGGSGYDLWPARPGEPQHPWEEPRVVADTRSKRGESRTWRDMEHNPVQFAQCCNGYRHTTQELADKSQRQHNLDIAGENGGEEKRDQKTDGYDRWNGERQTQPGMGREPNGTPNRLDPNRNRIDRLRLLGNGVVPATAAKAFSTLMGRILNPSENVRPVEVQLELF